MPRAPSLTPVNEQPLCTPVYSVINVATRKTQDNNTHCIPNSITTTLITDWLGVIVIQCNQEGAGGDTKHGIDDDK